MSISLKSLLKSFRSKNYLLSYIVQYSIFYILIKNIILSKFYFFRLKIFCGRHKYVVKGFIYNIRYFNIIDGVVVRCSSPERNQ